MTGIIKQIVVVRTDLAMGKGKIAAQVGHACVTGAENVKRSHPEWYNVWWETGQMKIVLKVSGIRALQEIKIHAIDLGLPWCEISDAGHTQLAPGTTTCVCLGPLPEDLANRVAGDLKLL